MTLPTAGSNIAPAVGWEPTPWHLYVRDNTLARVAEIDSYGKLDLVLRFNAAGSWAIDVPADSAVADLLATPGYGLVAVRNGEAILSGYATSWAWNETADGDTLESLLVSGPDDTEYLDRRVCLPDDPPYSAHGYDTESGVAETVMRHYVSFNLGPDADAARQLTGLDMGSDLVRGDSVSARARFDNLLELLQGIALAGGDIGFRLLQEGSAINWEVYEPRDLIGAIEFSKERGNLQSADFSQQAAEANYEIAGGGGTGTSRAFREHGDSASITRYGRTERFLDQRQTTVNAELDQAIDEDLAGAAEQISLAVTIRDTEGIAFMDDWQLGDQVRVVVRAATIEDVIREVDITLDSQSGESVTAVVGTPGAAQPHIDALFPTRQLRRLDQRISNVERT